MSNDKPMSLDDARSRAETMARVNEGRLKDFPGSIEAGQWRADARMLRTLLAVSGSGPTTRNAPTGTGDYDIVCDGCGEVVAEPHLWAECCAAQKSLVARLRDQLVSGPGTEAVCGLRVCRNCGSEGSHSWEECATELRRERDEAIDERDDARQYGDKLEDALRAIKEVLQAPSDMTALDAVKAVRGSALDLERAWFALNYQLRINTERTTERHFTLALVPHESRIPCWVTIDGGPINADLAPTESERHSKAEQCVSDAVTFAISLRRSRR